MASPMSSASLIVTLLLKVFNFVFLLISLIVLTSDTATAYIEILISTVTINVHFNNVYAYRYMLATNVIGFAYTLLQIVFSNFHITMGNHLISGDGGVISYLLATGAAVGFGVTKDLRTTLDGMPDDFDSFDIMGFAAANLLLPAFVCMAILSILSSYALAKKI
ncbi:hypothetical protein ACB094_07G008900 [Castanea mollissima]